MNDANCLVDQYRIKLIVMITGHLALGLQKTMGQPVNSCLWAANNTDKLILNLTPSTTYDTYRMKAWYCDGSGTSRWIVHGVQLETFTTEDDCPNVGNLTVSTLQVLLHKLPSTWDDSNGAYSFMRIKA